MGDPMSIARLQGPEMPDSVAYLDRLAIDLASGLPDGFKWEAVTAWAHAKDLQLLPHEYDALRDLVVLMRFPDAGEDET
jgi:hypothetical protein